MKARRYFEIGLIVPDTLWNGETAFEYTFAKFLEGQGLVGDKLRGKDKLIIEISEKESGPTVGKQDEKPAPQHQPREVLDKIFSDLREANTASKPKIKVFKESIL